MRKYKISVYGSAAGDIENALPKAVAVGQALGRQAESVIVLTGACSGLPYAAAKAAADQGTEIWGFASSISQAELHAEYPNDDLTIYDKLIYVPKNFAFADDDRIRKKFRNITSTAACDAAIIIAGRWGTLNEFTNVIDFQKVVGVLTGSGGVADELPELTAKIHKAGQGKIIFDDDPAKLVNKVLTTLTD